MRKKKKRKKKEEMAPRDGFPLWGGSVSESRPSASAAEGRRRGRWVGNESESMCVLFNVTADTVQKDGIMCEWRSIREASGERGGSGEKTPRSCGRGLSAGTKHLFKHWTFLCNFTR